MDKLYKNPWYLAKGPSIDVLEKEKKRVNYLDIGGEFVTGEWMGNFLMPERWNYTEAYLINEKGKILSTTPFVHSLSVDKTLSLDEVKKHISFYPKNLFYNRDFGFVVKNLKEKNLEQL